MAMSLNGYVTKSDDDTYWVSSTEWESYKNFVKDIGVIVCGRRTYEIALREGNLLTKEALNVVMTHNDDLISNDPKVLILANKTPEGVLNVIKEKGFEKVAIGGWRNFKLLFFKSGSNR